MIRMRHVKSAAAPQLRVLAVALLVLGAYLAGASSASHIIGCFGIPIEFIGQR